MQWSRIAGKPKGSKNSSALSDADLAERLRQKDERAFLSLYDLHRSAIFRFLMHMTGSITAAEELTQEVFVVILDGMCDGSIRQFDPQKGTLEGYLLGIARNLARAEQRKAQRLISLDSIIETPEWERLLNAMFQDNRSWDVTELIDARSDLRVLYRAILELPDHYREVVVLCGLQEKNYRDAALILQCVEGTIASRMNRAKSLLAIKLRRSGLTATTELADDLRGKEGTDVRTSIEADKE